MEDKNLIDIDTDTEDVSQESQTIEAGMNLYELNKMAYMQFPFIEKEVLETTTREKITEFLKATNCFYYMMLCKERSDYTLFNFSHYHINDKIANRAATDIFSCMKNRGLGILDLFVNDDNVLEIWVKEREEGAIPAVYYFFNYDEGVIDDYEDEEVLN
jgi:hypothetical protein